MKILLTTLLLTGIMLGQNSPKEFTAELEARTVSIIAKIDYVSAQMDNRNKQLAEYRAMTSELVRLQDPKSAAIMRPHLKRILHLLVEQGKIADPPIERAKP